MLFCVDRDVDNGSVMAGQVGLVSKKSLFTKSWKISILELLGHISRKKQLAGQIMRIPLKLKKVVAKH